MAVQGDQNIILRKSFFGALWESLPTFFFVLLAAFVFHAALIGIVGAFAISSLIAVPPISRLLRPIVRIGRDSVDSYGVFSKRSYSFKDLRDLGYTPGRLNSWQLWFQDGVVTLPPLSGDDSASIWTRFIQPQVVALVDDSLKKTGHWNVRLSNGDEINLCSKADGASLELIMNDQVYPLSSTSLSLIQSKSFDMSGIFLGTFELRNHGQRILSFRPVKLNTGIWPLIFYLRQKGFVEFATIGF